MNCSKRVCWRSEEDDETANETESDFDVEQVEDTAQEPTETEGDTTAEENGEESDPNVGEGQEILNDGENTEDNADGEGTEPEEGEDALASEFGDYQVSDGEYDLTGAQDGEVVKVFKLLKDTDGVERRYFMGYLGFDGWKELRWNNPQYISEIRNREIRVYPIYPRGLPFVKFEGFQITRDAAPIGGDFIGYFKDVKVIYDKALLTSDRDIADEDLWGIIGKKEKARQNAEMQRFGNKQVNRYLEKAKLASEDEFTSSLNDGSGSNAQSNGGQAADAK